MVLLSSLCWLLRGGRDRAHAIGAGRRIFLRQLCIKLHRFTNDHKNLCGIKKVQLLLLSCKIIVKVISGDSHRMIEAYSCSLDIPIVQYTFYLGMVIGMHLNIKLKTYDPLQHSGHSDTIIVPSQYQCNKGH